jgi:hypothetical protein
VTTLGDSPITPLGPDSEKSRAVADALTGVLDDLEGAVTARRLAHATESQAPPTEFSSLIRQRPPKVAAGRDVQATLAEILAVAARLRRDPRDPRAGGER